MIRSSSVLRYLAAASAIAALALTVGLSAAVPARADNTDTNPGLCLLLCPTESSQPEEPGKGKPGGPPPSNTPTPPPAAPAPAPTVPPLTAAPAPLPDPTMVPEPMVSAAETASSEPAASTAAPASASATASAASNWDQPVTRSAKPTQAAAVTRNNDSGLFGSPGLLAIMAGVLLIGMAGLAFAWWGRNRLSSH